MPRVQGPFSKRTAPDFPARKPLEKGEIPTGQNAQKRDRRAEGGRNSAADQRASTTRGVRQEPTSGPLSSRTLAAGKSPMRERPH